MGDTAQGWLRRRAQLDELNLKKNVDRMKDCSTVEAQPLRVGEGTARLEAMRRRLKGEQSDISSFACESMLDMCGRRKTRPRVGLMNGAGASRSERRHRGLGEVWPSDPFFVVNLAYYGFESYVLDYTFLVYTGHGHLEA